MNSNNSTFNEHEVLHELKHYLPSQAPLKDFIHHNTLHAFQNFKFHDGIHHASKIFGYFVSLQLEDYRSLYISKRIREDILKRIIAEQKGAEHAHEWMKNVLSKKYDTSVSSRIGLLRLNWKKQYHIDLDLAIHPLLFRILCSYLDQGISIWGFPVGHKGFLSSIREIEANSFTSFFKRTRAKKLLLTGNCKIEDLLKILVGDESLYKHYLYDQQFAHQGWSGIVSTIEDQPQSLLNPKKISLHDLVVFELLLEIDTLDSKFENDWLPIGNNLKNRPPELFEEVPKTELDEVLSIWQDAFEWSYYDPVLAAIQLQKKKKETVPFHKSFQIFTCIDDRELSFRRYLERVDPECETFATPGFFGVEFYYQPEHGKSYTKCCPAPVTPKYLIKETETRKKRKKEAYLSKISHSLFRGTLITQTLGLLSGFKLALNVFRPSAMPAMSSPIAHMDKLSKLTIENKSVDHKENDLQVGFTIDEMVQRVEAILTSVGLVKDFASIVYIVGHGATSINNPHYCAYDCGACGGRPGSVNARVFCFMANHSEVRAMLSSRGLVIPIETQFLGALHDTTRDEITYFDEDLLSPVNLTNHKKNIPVFTKALDLNSKERSRRLVSIDTHLSAEKIHKEILRRSVSLFEPRQELNHSTNASCFVGRRDLTKDIYLDRRSSMSSYDYRIDPEGKYLLNVMKPIAPVMGGISLEYFFSRVDNYRLGAGTKLPHNVMGLIGVANGSDGDLRPGLPSQMIEVHDPIRLLVIVEHFPEVVLGAINQQPATYEFYINEWVRLIAVNPETRELFLFKDGSFSVYHPLTRTLGSISDAITLIESVKAAESIHIVEATKENLPVYLMD
ncbi:YbcC family protein [Candidatus Nitrotoga sp. M5]|uniref:YbcC family protein n=1 Tax=Candidatus Nitrotoga sp. M5 TaxID=2890409 RepID=UPI001EF3E396|nr:DUF2309 domain-containing protein [Candidatus Nitrotoga sp. M5]CAH1387244.1 conserved hypothetical protein [Candidatus Nitrotoga sp. M5]